jgi:putative SOS response-associated peptidase YedK
MCGRAYETYSDEELYIRYLGKNPEYALARTPVYNLCPTQSSPIVRRVEGQRRLDMMRWQLVPKTEPEFSTRLFTINARSESVFDSPLFRDLVTRQRCIVPLSGFFEWKTSGARKTPFKVYFPDEPIMSVAGIWDTWHGGTPNEQHSFSILTTSANDFMKSIHDRMPVILNRDDEDAWLDERIHDRRTLQAFLKSCPSSWMNAVEVSTLVNSSKNNSPAVLEPASGPRLLFEL